MTARTQRGLKNVDNISWSKFIIGIAIGAAALIFMGMLAEAGLI
jgi:hypothetical protein